MSKRLVVGLAAGLCAVVLSSCMPFLPRGVGTPQAPAGGDVFRIVAGSEIKTIEPVVRKFFTEKGLRQPRIDYMGAVDISNRLSASSGEKIGYDAVWTANPFWIEMGDTGKRVKNVKTVMKSPVVFGVKRSVAERLGWRAKQPRIADIAAAAEAGRLRFVMTSATQSNSGASAYLGFLHAFNGGRTLAIADLADGRLREKATKLLGEVDRSSGSSAWLNDMFVSGFARYDAEVNYEALVIAADRGQAAGGTKLPEPLVAVYPVDGLSISNSSLGYVDAGDAKKAETFKQLQDYLLSPTAQKAIRAQGWRTGLGMGAEGADPTVFNPAWGIDTSRTLSAVRLPKAEVIRAAFDAYQTALRKPSLTVYCLDVSGSMGDPTPEGGTGIDQVKEAMHTLLDPEVARRYFLQPSAEDISIVVPFAQKPVDMWTVSGNDPAELAAALGRVDGLTPGGQTDIYTPVMRGIDRIATVPGLEKYAVSVILMTDGESNTGADLAALKAAVRRSGLKQEVPVFSIEFGNANPQQLRALADFSRGRVFDGRADLVRAFREAKGYN